LVSNGVPFDVAFALDDLTRISWFIIILEDKHNVKFNFLSMHFEEAKR